MAQILVIGSGGREHALARKLAQASEVSHIFIAPGNAGTAKQPKCENVDLSTFQSIVDFCKKEKIELVVVGPEAPLAEGIADVLEANDILVFGPSAKAAQIETSKDFAKQFMQRHGIPTARYQTFTSTAEALQFLENPPFNALVIKADGLAAGKGVVVAENLQAAKQAVVQLMEEKAVGSAGEKVVIEELLEGEEVSCFALSDGKSIACLPPSQDHKRLLDGDQGPNTGGMGAYCPCPFVSSQEYEFIQKEILQKAIDGFRKDGTAFKGLLYAGLMMTREGPKVLEYNCRFGDPETQVVLAMLNADLFQLTKACATGQLSSHVPGSGILSVHPGSAVCVVAVSGGYPNAYKKGLPIAGLEDESSGDSSTYVIHAGTKLGDNSQVLTSGGRVLATVSQASNLSSALANCMSRMNGICFPDMFYRKDIGQKALRK